MKYKRNILYILSLIKFTACQQEKTSVLTISAEMNDKLTTNGWFDIDYDLSGYEGKKILIQIQGSKGTGAYSKMYLKNLSIE